MILKDGGEADEADNIIGIGNAARREWLSGYSGDSTVPSEGKRRFGHSQCVRTAERRFRLRQSDFFHAYP